MLHIKTEEEYVQVVERYSDMIFRMAYQNLFNASDAEDVVQDVFLKLLRQKDKCFNDCGHLKSWLIRVTINQCLDYKKSFFRKNTVPLEDLEIPYEQEERGILEELYRLPRDYRNILYLYYYEGYTIREIAHILGKKQNTANAKELTENGEVYPDDYASLSNTICDLDNLDELSFAFDFPVQCKGENIDTITYAIKEGAFEISNPKGKSIVVDGQWSGTDLNVPGRCMADLADDDDLVRFEGHQYQSFTVDYDHQMNDQTCIDVVGTAEMWSKEKRQEAKKLDALLSSSLQGRKELCDFLVKDMGITCTVTYKDGSTETKDIVVSNRIVKPSEITGEKLPEEKDQEMVVRYFSIR